MEKKYKVHAKLLKLWVEQGWIVTKVHRAMKFRQTKWLESFIAFCTSKRTQAKTEFEKSFWKLLANSCYGKFLENVRERCDIHIAGTEKKVKKLLKKPNIKTLPVSINDNKFVMVELSKTTTTLDKPVYIGCVVLDLSKYLMYDFWYNSIRKEYGDSAQLVYTDTDSLIFSVETEDIYADLKNTSLGEKFDFSDYQQQHYLYSNQN